MEPFSHWDSTTLAAWWGAIAGTVAILWDVVKWSRQGARVQIVTRCNVGYPDSRVTSTKQTEHGQVQSLAVYCHIEVRNMGDAPTTIIGIKAAHKPGKEPGLSSFTYPAISSLDDRGTPAVLAPGELWAVRIEMDHMHTLAKRGRPYIEVQSTQRIRPIRAYVKVPVE